MFVVVNVFVVVFVNVFLRVRVIDPGVFVVVFAGGESPASATCSSS